MLNASFTQIIIIIKPLLIHDMQLINSVINNDLNKDKKYNHVMAPFGLGLHQFPPLVSIMR